eukprot:TRINITY_DN37534_c0_g1_i1.p1 TRINITY_DN37534_c0_g1~~TRINITY_DN37534_c0_g1_i1.p1  ORF type:complete len:269 (+),score=18.72 TRINITY_DN37534_c0_g1_i1:48-809(+)
MNQACYDLALLGNTTLPEELICESMGGVVRNARRGVCGHLICEGCPMSCNRCGLEAKTVSKIDARVENIVVGCRNARGGCEWSGNLESAERHCSMCLVNCKECGQQCNDIQKHNRICSTSCSSCGLDLMISEVEEHLLDCHGKFQRVSSSYLSSSMESCGSESCSFSSIGCVGPHTPRTHTRLLFTSVLSLHSSIARLESSSQQPRSRSISPTPLVPPSKQRKKSDLLHPLPRTDNVPIMSLTKPVLGRAIQL